jgi:hypothetical protein
VYKSGALDWLNNEGEQLSRLKYKLVKKNDIIFCRFFMRFIPFAEVENAMAVFHKSLENNIYYKYYYMQLNSRYKYIPFAKTGWDSPDYYMFVYDIEKPENNPTVVVYHTQISIMYTCAVNFQDLMFQHLVYSIKMKCKNEEITDIINAYAMFLSHEYAKLALNGEYDALIKLYNDFLLTEDGFTLDKQMLFPHLVSPDLPEEETPPSKKLFIDNKAQKIAIEHDDQTKNEAKGKTTSIKKKKKSVQCNKSISFIDPLLPKDSFFRCHKSLIVGFKHIAAHSERNIIFDNGKEAIVSKRKYSEFKARYTKYLE